MSVVATAPEASAGFTVSHERFTTVLAFLDGAEAAAASHAELEEHLQVASRELFRLLYQDHLDLRAQREAPVMVVGADATTRSRVETGHTRALSTVFGKVTVTRIAYRAPGSPNQRWAMLARPSQALMWRRGVPIDKRSPHSP